MSTRGMTKPQIRRAVAALERLEFSLEKEEKNKALSLAKGEMVLDDGTKMPYYRQRDMERMQREINHLCERLSCLEGSPVRSSNPKYRHMYA